MKIIMYLFFLSLSLSSYSEELKIKDDAKALAENIMELVGKGQAVKGLELMRPHVIIPEHEFDTAIDQFNMQSSAITQRFGKTIGYEFFKTEEVGESLMLIMYVQKFEKHIMRWKFYFYKPQDKWLLNTFNFDDSIELMFNEI